MRKKIMGTSRNRSNEKTPLLNNRQEKTYATQTALQTKPEPKVIPPAETQATGIIAKTASDFLNQFAASSAKSQIAYNLSWLGITASPEKKPTEEKVPNAYLTRKI
jgi:hypothetical protein